MRWIVFTLFTLSFLLAYGAVPMKQKNVDQTEFNIHGEIDGYIYYESPMDAQAQYTSQII